MKMILKAKTVSYPVFKKLVVGNPVAGPITPVTGSDNVGILGSDNTRISGSN